MGSGLMHNLDELSSRDANWSSLRVGVLGLGIAGFAAADALMQLGSKVSIIDSSSNDEVSERANILGSLGASVFLNASELPEHGLDLVVTSPGLPPQHHFHIQAELKGIPIWGELELAWRIRSKSGAAEWLCVTGTNGKTTTTLMLDSILRAAGLRTEAAGNIGHSLVGVVMHDELDVIAVEVGAPQLPFVHSISPWASVCLNIASDHIDHFGNFNEYANAKARIYERTQYAAVYNGHDEATLSMVESAEVQEGCRAVGFTRGIPGLSELGVVDGALVDRAFIPNRRDYAQELALVSDIHPAADHNTENALAASALARAFGVVNVAEENRVSPTAVRDGLRNFDPAPHRNTLVANEGGVTYVDDSKATNAHAAHRSLSSYPSVIWIAGGLAKGQDFDELVMAHASRLKLVILLGTDAPIIADALTRHAPNVPVITLVTRETSAMNEAVQIAHVRAVSGDTVLLAPGCASWDMFTNYSHRGEIFASAVANELGH
jgi:UDP-N-acetylmuramoylalanine--D-glutamate ligase